jgi:hypothetical protein
MKRMTLLLIAGLMCLIPDSTEGRGGGGGGGGGRGGGGGMSRSAGRSPSFSRSAPSRPSGSYARPAQRPSSPVSHTPSFSRPTQMPSYGGSRASVAQRPATPGINRSSGGAINRPGAGGSGINRPSSGDLGNFLNMPTQGGPGGIASNRPSQLPAHQGGGSLLGTANRPGGVNRASQLPANRPGGGPSGMGNRPGVGNRPSQLPARGDRGAWNNYRNNRASNVRNFTQNNFKYNRLATRPGGWWGGGYGRGFAHGWAASNAWHGWGGFWGWHGYPPGFWWSTATTVAGLTAWCASLFVSHPEPVYYDYGNTVYVDNSTVYMDGQPLASEEQYASQAMQYADVSVPAPPELSDTGTESPDEDAAMQAYAENWMPLGVFAVASEKDDDSEPSHFLQLAVSKEGYIAGTCYNSIRDETLPITGSVDKQSQRAAWKVADKPDVVMETGIFNLTQDTAPALLHFGKDKTETRLLVRMEKPKQ